MSVIGLVGVVAREGWVDHDFDPIAFAAETEKINDVGARVGSVFGRRLPPSMERAQPISWYSAAARSATVTINSSRPDGDTSTVGCIAPNEQPW
ncbi:hypothetical protein [Nannocystis punicea]|uniref:Uncharacterized protein n=1 Tax=Nannocystis punicea TaxID=2995304 RepID=A0ABY7H9U3_9BACT|nr:hypothetical protein [Nannocystis poenicansa]WAS96042.1 hypothetical protein O0S08_07745 [Nannocystis poenicansa]